MRPFIRAVDLLFTVIQQSSCARFTCAPFNDESQSIPRNVQASSCELHAIWSSSNGRSSPMPAHRHQTSRSHPYCIRSMCRETTARPRTCAPYSRANTSRPAVQLRLGCRPSESGCLANVDALYCPYKIIGTPTGAASAQHRRREQRTNGQTGRGRARLNRTPRLPSSTIAGCCKRWHDGTQSQSCIRTLSRLRLPGRRTEPREDCR